MDDYQPRDASHDGTREGVREVPGRASTSSNGRATLYRLNSNQSSSSIFEEVEMAHDEVHTPVHLLIESAPACPSKPTQSL